MRETRLFYWISTLCASLFLMCLLSACGTPGAPQPPSLKLPKRVEDLRALRQGDKVTLTWTTPADTTDEQGITGPVTARICRDFRDKDQVCVDRVAELTVADAERGKQKSVTDDVAPLVAAGNRDFVIYSLQTISARGRSAGVSNPATVFLAPSMPAPEGVNSKVARGGIEISWRGTAPPQQHAHLNSEYLYRVERVEEGQKRGHVVVGNTAVKPGELSVTDSNFEWDKTYDYRVVGITRVLSREGKELAQFEGVTSPAIRVIAKDVFPPDPPQGVQAVATKLNDKLFIDLTWTPNSEADLAGYNVYRVNTTPLKGDTYPMMVRINKGLVKSPTYRDESVAPNQPYDYYVSAVDAHGNESERSQPTHETTPQ